jgi:hypothetical protein
MGASGVVTALKYWSSIAKAVTEFPVAAADAESTIDMTTPPGSKSVPAQLSVKGAVDEELPHAASRLRAITETNEVWAVIVHPEMNPATRKTEALP